MGIFSKLFKGPEIDMEKSAANAKKMRALFDNVVEGGSEYRLIFGYTEDVSRFNYGFVHGSKTKIGNLIVGWNEAQETIVVVPTVPDLSGCGDPTFYRRADILFLPPRRHFEGLSEQIPHRCFCHLPGQAGLHRHQRLRLAGGREPVRLCVPGRGTGRLHRVLYEPLCEEVRL